MVYSLLRLYLLLIHSMNGSTKNILLAMYLNAISFHPKIVCWHLHSFSILQWLVKRNLQKIIFPPFSGAGLLFLLQQILSVLKQGILGWSILVHSHDWSFLRFDILKLMTQNDHYQWYKTIHSSFRIITTIMQISPLSKS